MPIRAIRRAWVLVTVEAIACGCPVVVGDVAVVADIFQDTEMDMRAIPGDPENLAAKITNILLAPEAAIQRTMEIRERLQQQMGWESVASRYGGDVEKCWGAAHGADDQAGSCLS